MNTLEILDGWGLLARDFDVTKLTMREWRDLAEEIFQAYEGNLQHEVGAAHVGLHLGTQIFEGAGSLSSLAVPIVTSQTVWLPDPFFSFLVRSASETWAILPEAGSSFFTSGKGPMVKWRGLWDYPKEGRRNAARAKLPLLLSRLKELKPLIETGAVKFFPWEKLLEKSAISLKETIHVLSQNPDFEKVTTLHRQDQYNLGVRIGALGITAAPTSTDPNLPPGTPLWFVDRNPVAIAGVLNLLTSTEIGATLIPELPGDRDVYNYIRSGAVPNPAMFSLGPTLKFPRLAAALWPDVVEIRKSNDVLATFRGILSDASNIEEEKGIEAISNRLKEAAVSLRGDKSLWKVVNNATAELALAVLGGAFAGQLQNTPEKVAAICAAAGAAGPFFLKLFSGITEHIGNRRRADVVLSVADRL